MPTRSVSNLKINEANSFEIFYLHLTLNLTKKTTLPERLQRSLRFSIEFLFDGLMLTKGHGQYEAYFSL